MTPQTVTTPPCLRTVTANDPLLLIDPAVLWQVKSGRMAVFVVPFMAGEPAGERRYLFTVEAGEAPFSPKICPVTGLEFGSASCAEDG